MEAALTTFLVPFLPYLVKKVEAGADKAIERFGAAAWDHAQAIWRRLGPKVEEKKRRARPPMPPLRAPTMTLPRGRLSSNFGA